MYARTCLNVPHLSSAHSSVAQCNALQHTSTCLFSHLSDLASSFVNLYLYRTIQDIGENPKGQRVCVCMHCACVVTFESMTFQSSLHDLRKNKLNTLQHTTPRCNLQKSLCLFFFQTRNYKQNTLFLLFRFSITGLADQLKFISAMQNITIHTSRKICKCDLAPENAETPR